MMRVSTLQFYKQNLSLFDSNQAEMLKQQIHISTGKRIQTPSDAPIESARISILQERISITEAYNQNAESVQRSLESHELNMGYVLDSLQRLNELQVRAGNASLTNESRSSIAQEAEQILEQVLDISNSRDSNGNFFYSGSQTRTLPFTINDGIVTYNGDSSFRETNVTANMFVPISYSGFDVFMDIESTSGDFTITTGFNQAVDTDPQWPFREIFTAANFPTFPALPHTNLGDKPIEGIEITDSALYLQNVDDYFIHFDTSSFPETRYSIYDSDGQTIVADIVFDEDTPIEFNGIEVTFAGTGTIADDDIFHLEPTRRESVFDTIERMVTNLERPKLTDTEREIVEAEDQRLLDQLNHTMNHFIEEIALLGSRAANVSLAEEGNSNIIASSRETISLLEDTNLAEAITLLQAETLYLQAAQQTFTKVQQLSVFNYL